MAHVAQSIGQWVAYVPTWTGFSADPTSVTARYTLNGKMCSVYVVPGSQGTSNATTFTVTLPFNAKNVCAYVIRVADSGTWQTGLLTTAAGSNIATVYKTTAAGAFTNSGVKGTMFNILYEAE